MSLYQGTTLIAGKTPVPTGAMTYKGTCLQADLPTSGRSKGDYWKLSDVSPSTYSGQCAIWNGDSWDYSTANIVIDATISASSTNPVENKAIYEALQSKVTKEDGKGLFSGNYNDLDNKPVIFSGDYNDLTNKPTLFSGNYNDLTNKPTLFSGDYNDLTNKPSLNYLPLAGGTMTGGIVIRKGDNGVVNSVNDSYTEICGGKSSSNNGAYLTLRGKEEGLGGKFRLCANDGTTTTALEGKPNKKLYWDSKSLAPIGCCALSGHYMDNNGNVQNWGMPPGAVAIGFAGTIDGNSVPFAFVSGGAMLHFYQLDGTGSYGGGGGSYYASGTVYYIYPGFVE